MDGSKSVLNDIDNLKIQFLSRLRLNAIVMSISMIVTSTACYALEEITEQELSQINAEDGIFISNQYDKISIDNAYWQDQAGSAEGNEKTLSLSAKNISMTGENIGTSLSVNTGSVGGNPGIDLALTSDIGTTLIDQLKFCDEGSGLCSSSIGSLTLQSTQPIKGQITTQSGLFNQDMLSKLNLDINGLNVYFTQKQNDTVNNQLIFKNFSFGFTSEGYAYIDPVEGIVLKTGTLGYIGVNRNCLKGADCTNGYTSTNSTPGINIDILLKANSASSASLDNAKGVMRLGMSGYLNKAQFNIRGTNGNDTVGANILGKAFSASNTTSTADATAASLIGSTGIALRARAAFNNTASTPNGQLPTTIELAHGGDNAYGLSFSEFTPLLIRKQNNGGLLNTDQAYLDTGDVYINLVNTKKLTLPQNATLMSIPFAGSSFTNTSSYVQSIHNLNSNPNAILFSIRGSDFQALSHSTQFITSPNVTNSGVINTDGNNWGLGLPFYNLNSNLALYGMTVESNKDQIGFSFGLSTQGINRTALSDGSLPGSKTTSILLIDGNKYGNNIVNGVRTADNNGSSVNYYIGLRNIDLLADGYGLVNLDNGRVNITLDNFNIFAATDIAVGYLPGSQYLTANKGYSPINGFLNTQDALFGLRLKLGGNASLILLPGGTTLDNNYTQFVGEVNLLNNSGVQMVDLSNNSIIGFDKISGRINTNNSIQLSKDTIKIGSAVTINPNKNASEVLRIKDLNLYPSTNGITGVSQRLGEVAITGGKVVTQLTMIPH